MKGSEILSESPSMNNKTSTSPGVRSFMKVGFKFDAAFKDATSLSFPSADSFLASFLILTPR